MKKPTIAELKRAGITSHRISKYKVKFISSFDMLKMSQERSSKEIAEFFKTNIFTIKKIKEMQIEGGHVEKFFPGVFDEMEEIETRGEWDELKGTLLYKRLMNENKQH